MVAHQDVPNRRICRLFGDACRGMHPGKSPAEAGYVVLSMMRS